MKELIQVQPVVFRTDIEMAESFSLCDNAEFFIEERNWQIR
jgi:hypothetical protein